MCVCLQMPAKTPRKMLAAKRPAVPTKPWSQDLRKGLMAALNQAILRQARPVRMPQPFDDASAFVPAYPAPYQVHLKSGVFTPDPQYPGHKDITEECDKLLVDDCGTRIVSVKVGDQILTAALSMSRSLSIERLNSAARGSPEQMAATKLYCMIVYHGEPGKAVTGDLLRIHR